MAFLPMPRRAFVIYFNKSYCLIKSRHRSLEHRGLLVSSLLGSICEEKKVSLPLFLESYDFCKSYLLEAAVVGLTRFGL